MSKDVIWGEIDINIWAYIIYCFLGVANIYIYSLKNMRGFHRFVWCFIGGPFATMYLMFYKDATPDKDHRIYEIYRGKLLKKKRRVSQWDYLNQVIDILKKERLEDDEILKLKKYVNADVEIRKNGLPVIVAVVSIAMAIVTGFIFPSLGIALYPTEGKEINIIGAAIEMVFLFVLLIFYFVIIIHRIAGYERAQIVKEGLDSF
ncbi:hypothetical protein UB51_16825 [Paenibacillus sp. IHBB 10380]|nr:hypothetical protein UB51_16825 [Paenibacillus sp. IHBB 10380]